VILSGRGRRHTFGYMKTRRFLPVALVSVAAAAGALALAEVLDAPWLRIVAVGLLLGVLVAREVWAWRGRGRLWIGMVAGLLGVVVLAFVVEKAAG
jgi:hypothetical protein